LHNLSEQYVRKRLFLVLSIAEL